ncbi:MAG: hypothetical protein C0594_01255 [Marinilabiliales bacterium]|nr:MAG: hypothetical protein C0594_01255 [Marinilabiliales bacterium]
MEFTYYPNNTFKKSVEEYFSLVVNPILNISFDDYKTILKYIKQDIQIKEQITDIDYLKYFCPDKVKLRIKYLTNGYEKYFRKECLFLTGIDLPIWFKGKGRNKNIMILAQDPLRSLKSVTNSNIDPYDHITLWTPFSYQVINKNRENTPREKHYWDIINHIGDMSRNIYVTDIRKIWFSGWENHTEINFDKIYSEIFKNEVELFDPDYIICFGRDAEKAAVKIKRCFDFRFNTIYLIHPSNRASSGRDSFFVDKHGIRTFRNDNLIESYKIVINRSLK